MTPNAPASPEPDAEADRDALPLVLRESRKLQQIPPERPPAPALPSVPAAATPAAVPGIALAHAVQAEGPRPAAGTVSQRLIAAPPPELTWALASVALAAGVGWVYERRRRRQMEIETGAGRWPTVRNMLGRRAPAVQPKESADSSPADPAAPAHVSVPGETTSRREATLVDLHLLRETLQKLRTKGQLPAAAELLEQHLLDFRYSSPWVFLELRELYQQLDRPQEWELARDAFRNRFGQNAPQWAAASTAGVEIADDEQLRQELLRKWPRRDARLFILRWMLGDALSRQKNSGPPLLALGVYRDMMLLDTILDEVMAARTPTPALA